MGTYVIKNVQIVNEKKISTGDILIKNKRIEKIESEIENTHGATEIDGTGKYLLPGVIDDQVHFREPGLTHKAEIHTESLAAVAGGTTSFMEMPNTNPTTTTQDELQKKYDKASQVSLANYSFFMGGANDNYEEVMKTDLSKVCGLKLFMGSSTGNMLVDDANTLKQYFSNFEGIIATHCEDEESIRKNTSLAKEKHGDNIPMHLHPVIRNEDACFKSSSEAIELAKKYNTRLHILHISTKKELELFSNSLPLKEKLITSEVCVHHLWFDSSQYHTLGSQIKCNPAIKEKKHKQALIKALLDDTLDIIATDHAPHTWNEKSNLYLSAPSGLPLVQYSLHLMLEYYHKGIISLEKIVDKMCHAPAICFNIQERGFIREGYFADLVLVDINKTSLVNERNILYKCGWSPFNGKVFNSSVEKTFVNGHMAYNHGNIDESVKGLRLLFLR